MSVGPIGLTAASEGRLARPGQLDSVFVASGGAMLILLGALFASDRTWHWFTLPTLVCGALISLDAVDWFRGRRDVFDPAGIVGVLGTHIFFMAPLLHVARDYWLLYVTPPDDWREWIGKMSLLNIIGIIVYLFTREVTASWLSGRRSRAPWVIDREKFAMVVGLGLLGTALLQGWVYASYGGLSGYVGAYAEDQENSFQGMGWIFAFSESFPILAMMAVAVLVWGRDRTPSWPAIGLVLFGFLALKLIFGGLRGSRSSTVWALFWATGIVHLRVRPIPRKVVGLGLVFLIAFMYVYGFYKNYGMNALDALEGSDRMSEMASRSNRTLDVAILSDLGRADVQAYLLFRLAGSAGSDYSYAFGKTYLATATMLVPKSIWPGRPDGKVRQGTEALYGRTTYALRSMRASQVYGLAGEAMLNFGPAAVPISYVVLGAVVAQVGCWFRRWGPGDSRRLLLPFLINLAFVLIVSDSDNILFFLLKDGAVPSLIVALGSRRGALSGTFPEIVRTGA